MSGRWAGCTPAGNALSLGMLRTMPGIEVCEEGEFLWLRGENPDEALLVALRKIPELHLNDVLDDGRLRHHGRRIPSGRLPDGPWQRLSAWIQPDPQPAALPGTVGPKVCVSLIRDSAERAANVLRTDISRLDSYATRAPAIRLESLCFAMNSRKEIIVQGTPLPPITGERYAATDGIAAPCGYTWSPRVEPAVLRALFGSHPEDLILLRVDGGFDRVSADSFVRATRSAVRLSREGLSGA